MLKLFKKNKKKISTTDFAGHNFQDLTIEELKEFKFNAWTHKNTGVHYEGNVEKNFFSNVTFKYFLEYIKPTDKVLDVGAGTGRLSLPLAELGCDVVAIDISEDMLKVIDEKKGNTKIQTVAVNCEILPFEDSSFDSVVALDAMIHFPNWQDFLAEQTRVVKKDGIIAFNFYSGENFSKIENNRNKASDYMTGGHFCANATKEELYDICGKFNLELIRQQPFNFLCPCLCSYGILTSEELNQFNRLYLRMLNNPKFLEIITLFEERVVKDLPIEDCSNMLVILKKK